MKNALITISMTSAMFAFATYVAVPVLAAEGGVATPAASPAQSSEKEIDVPAKPADVTAKPGDIPADLKPLVDRAEKGDAAAQIELANHYARGSEVPEDDMAAAKWWRKAAEQGNAQSQYELGHLYYEGTPGIARDYNESCKWFGAAAKQDIIAAEFYLGLCYGNGHGLKKNHDEAYFWVLVAKKHGWQVSQVLLDKFATDLTPAQLDAAKLRADKWMAAHAAE